MPDSDDRRYLVDTNILSVGAPPKRGADARVAEWLDTHSAHLRLSVATITEIEDGIAKARRQGATTKAQSLADWLDAIIHLYEDQILPVDVAVAREAGRLLDRARSRGRAFGLADMLIAATARVHGLIVLTRNRKDFVDCDVAVSDPYSGDLAIL